MSKFAVLFFALVSFYAHAETYLCVAEAGAVVEDGGREGINAGLLAGVSNKKFIQTNDSGKWLVKELGRDSALFDKCSSQYLCESANGYAGVFMRPPSSGVFSVTFMTRLNEINQLVVAKGRCTKL